MGDYSTNAIQEGDTQLALVNNAGDIEERDGFTVMSAGIGNMILLALGGGNDKDDGSESTEKLQWWGNEGEPPARQLRSRFQALCASGQPITSASAALLASAAEYDLGRAFLDSGLAESVELTSISIPSPKRLELAGIVTLVSGDVIPFEVIKELTT